MSMNNDDSRYRNDNDSNREGRTSSPRKTINIGSREQSSRPVYSSSNDGNVKKKRPRVGDARVSNPNERSSYNNNGGGYDRPQRDYNDRRPNNGGGGYNNNGGGYNNNGGGYGRPSQGGGQFGPKKRPMLNKPIKYKEEIDPNTPIRLNKYLANAGVCSRREADTFIEAGVVKVNGEVVNELGAKVLRGDLVTFHDEPVRLESKVYVLLNKPKNTLTTSDDPKDRKTVMDLVKNACPERIFPVGRLDRNTTGVLLLTNDGDLASKLMHPKYKKKKIYQVTLDRDVAMEDMQAIADGIELEDGEIHADSIAYVAEDVFNEVGIEIHSGRNRLVRRIFEKLGYHVIKLDRVLFAGLTKKNLPKGKWRYLNEQEVNMLRMGAFE